MGVGAPQNARRPPGALSPLQAIYLLAIVGAAVYLGATHVLSGEAVIGLLGSALGYGSGVATESSRRARASDLGPPPTAT